MAQGSARYERSAAGMVGAMIVTVLVIIVFVAFRALNRDELVVERDAVDYLQMVEGLQGGNDLHPAYPETLPDGWTATRAIYDADNLAWELDVLTDEGAYIGLRQAAIRDRDLVEEYADPEAKPGKDVDLTSAVATAWRAWDVDGDDTAYTAELADGEVLLVFGAAPAREIAEYVDLLVQEPV